jgi:DNA polymerase-3 subunit delta'
MDFLSADSLPWLADWQRKLRDALRAQRFPHSVLLLSTPGLGAESFAHWLTALALCESADDPPCGACASCSLLRSDTHPDYYPINLQDKAQQIKVDQIRELIGSLALKSYRGGYKVSVVEGAEALNTAAANAFLKTLEEPAGNTLLVLIARPSHRLPATIASRCLRLPLRTPPHAVLVQWLEEHGAAGLRWDAAREFQGGAPLLALDLNGPGIAALDADMRESVRAIAAGRVDVTLVAEQWARSDLGLRLVWLENWITRRVHTSLGGAGSQQTAERARLPAALLKPKISPLFDLLDATRDLRRLASTGMNHQLALEALLLGGRTALAE